MAKIRYDGLEEPSIPKRLPDSQNVDARRTLDAWNRGTGEIVRITVVQGGIFLGGHSHCYKETFYLAKGSAVLHTWNKRDARQIKKVFAPCEITVPAGEEHIFKECEKGMVLIALTEGKFKPTPAEHLD